MEHSLHLWHETINLFTIMKKRFFLASVIALGMMTGCNNEYDGQDVSGSKLIVTASIDQVKTRVSDTEWAVDDAIGVSDNLPQNPNLNIKYVAGSTTGNFTSVSGIYILGAEPVTYTAYYPYTGAEGTAAGDIEFSILNSEGQYAGDSNVDYLFAEATASRENPTVGFRFKHVMSRLKLTIKDSDNAVSEGTELSYTLKGVTTDGTFNTTNGTVTAGTSTGTIVVKTTMGSSSSVILPPTPTGGTPASLQLVIEINDKVYTGSFTPALTASQEYQYSIDLSNTGSGEKLQIDSPTIDGFTPNDEGDINMNVTANYNPTLEVGDFICKDGTQIDKDYDFANLDATVKESIVGVVFYVGNPQPSELYGYNNAMDVLEQKYPACTNGLVYALKRADTAPASFGTVRPSNSEGEWYDSYATSFITATGNTDRILGYNYTHLFETFATDNAETGACSSVMTSVLDAYRKSTSVASSTTNWYLPSMGELNIIKVAQETLNTSLSKVEGAELLWEDTDVNEKTGYWSSSLRRRDAVLCYLNGAESPDSTVGYFTSNKHFYRFVFAF